MAQKRGATPLLAPAGKVLVGRPSFRWEAGGGTGRWRVTLSTDEGDEIWSSDAEAGSLSFPGSAAALAPGARYIWEAAGTGPFGSEGGRRAFDVASEAEIAAFAQASAAIEARVPAPLRPLVRAQWALRRGLYEAAERDAAEFLAAHPGDPVGTATLAAARGALGHPPAPTRER